MRLDERGTVSRRRRRSGTAQPRAAQHRFSLAFGWPGQHQMEQQQTRLERACGAHIAQCARRAAVCGGRRFCCCCCCFCCESARRRLLHTLARRAVQAAHRLAAATGAAAEVEWTRVHQPGCLVGWLAGRQAAASSAPTAAAPRCFSLSALLPLLAVFCR